MIDDQLQEQIEEFMEATRDEDGAYTFVYLPARGIMVNVDVCTDIVLQNEVHQELRAMLDETLAAKRKADARLKFLEWAENIEVLKGGNDGS